MRKLSFLFLFVAAGLVSTTTYAQEMKKEVKEVVKKQQEKVEIQISELPEAITKTLSSEFADLKADKAYKFEKEGKSLFYVKLKSADKHIKVTLDTEGNVLSKKDLKKDTQS
tara:strand:- start:59306 stop:59641 length:336 start_codon:yes stop_codon:yes gene_type:complete